MLLKLRKKVEGEANVVIRSGRLRGGPTLLEGQCDPRNRGSLMIAFVYSF